MKTIEQTPNVIDWSKPVGIHCIDDRGHEGATQDIKNAAGSYGYTLDTYAARAIGRDGKLDVYMPVGVGAKVVTKGLSRYALLGCIHEACAAEGGVLAIADQFATNGEFILNETNRLLDGSVKESTFEKLQGFHEQLSTDERLFRGVAIEAAAMDSDDDLPRIPRSRLLNAEHAATQLRINMQKDTWYDAATTYAQGKSEYNYDLWAVPLVAEKINTIIPHDNIEGFVIASVARTVAISRLLPRDHTATGIDIAVH